MLLPLTTNTPGGAQTNKYTASPGVSSSPSPPPTTLPATLRWAPYRELNGRASLSDGWNERLSFHRSSSLRLPPSLARSPLPDPSWVFLFAARRSEGRAEGWLQARSSSLTCCCCCCCWDKWLPKCCWGAMSHFDTLVFIRSDSACSHLYGFC